MRDSTDYQTKKQALRRWLTVYGRNPVEACLQDAQLRPKVLHLADSNQKSDKLDRLIALAKKRGCDVRFHDRDALARISKNKKQDQGVALDVECQAFNDLSVFLQSTSEETCRLILLDRVTNPQNLGMILRSTTAAGITGVIVPERGCAPLGPLVAKASAGTLFHAPVLRCTSSSEALDALLGLGFTCYTLSSHTESNFFEEHIPAKAVFVLGNESEGVAPDIASRCQVNVRIPMHNGVESLNVAITAALIAYYLDR
jgi:23S rRNA (guanosine2251-2'-O)-methyltransferase